MGMKSSWLKSLGLTGPGLKLGVEKSGVDMSFNRKETVQVAQGMTPNQPCINHFNNLRILVKPNVKIISQAYVDTSMQKSTTVSTLISFYP